MNPVGGLEAAESARKLSLLGLLSHGSFRPVSRDLSSLVSIWRVSVHCKAEQRRSNVFHPTTRDTVRSYHGRLIIDHPDGTAPPSPRRLHGGMGLRVTDRARRRNGAAG